MKVAVIPGAQTVAALPTKTGRQSLTLHRPAIRLETFVTERGRR